MKPLSWLEIVVGFIVLTLLVTYLIPKGSLSDSPLIVFRYIFAFVFVVFLPGYCLVDILFLGKNRLDLVEKFVLSVALSFGLTGLIGLFLGLSPIGLTFESITISLSATVLALAVIAFIQKRKEALPVLQVQSSEKVSA